MSKYILLLLVSFLACKSDNSTTSADSSKKLTNGYEFINYTNNPGKKPTATQVVTVDFQIIDEFKNKLSDSRTANIRPTIQIPVKMNVTAKRNPLLALVRTMTINDSAIVFVPVDSLSSPPQEFLQSSQVDYVVKVLNIENQEDYMDRVGRENKEKLSTSLAEAKEAFDRYMAGDFEKDVIKKNGQVKVAVVKDSGGPTPNYNDRALVHYYGFFEDGSTFDNSYKTGNPYGFKVGRGPVIQGWHIGITDVPKGGTAILDVPYQMAYGKSGRDKIPPKARLIFWVKVDDIEVPVK